MEDHKLMSVAELQTIMAKQQQELADRIIAADQEIARRKAMHEAEMAKERKDQEAYHKSKAAEREREQEALRVAAAEKAKADMAEAVRQEQEQNARAEDEKRIREHLYLLRQRAVEIEALEEKLKKSLVEKISNPSIEQAEGEPSPEEMSSHLRDLFHMNNRDTVGLERPEQYLKTL